MVRPRIPSFFEMDGKTFPQAVQHLGRTATTHRDIHHQHCAIRNITPAGGLVVYGSSLRIVHRLVDAELVGWFCCSVLGCGDEKSVRCDAGSGRRRFHCVCLLGRHQSSAKSSVRAVTCHTVNVRRLMVPMVVFDVVWSLRFGRSAGGILTRGRSCSDRCSTQLPSRLLLRTDNRINQLGC